ncbi:MAG: glucosamine-6-phosphate deaminase [Cyanobacteriota bacterium]
MTEFFSTITGVPRCAPIPVGPERLRLPLLPLEDAAAVARHGAEELLAAVGADPAWPLGLATGRTMEPLYAELVRLVRALPRREQQGLRQRWLSFNLDEYVGAPGPSRCEQAQSFRAFMAAQLMEPLQLTADQVCLPHGLALDPQVEAERYGAAVAAAGGIGLQLLGLGLNGHVGFNEPPCGPEAACRVVNLSASTRRQNAAAFGGDPAATPAQAITLGLAEILAARRILLVVTGASKAAVLARLLRDPPSAALPASWLQGHPAVTVVADRAALSAVILP